MEHQYAGPASQGTMTLSRSDYAAEKQAVHARIGDICEVCEPDVDNEFERLVVEFNRHTEQQYQLPLQDRTVDPGLLNNWRYYIDRDGLLDPEHRIVCLDHYFEALLSTDG